MKTKEPSAGHRMLAAFRRSRLGRLLSFTVVCVSLVTGCAPKSYETALQDINNLDRLLKLTAPSTSTPQAQQALMELPRMKARLCLQRAMENHRGSNWTTTVDMLMLVTAGAAAGTGTAMGAASTAMDAGDAKKDTGVVSVTLLAAGGAVLGLRAALGLNEVGRTQRIAAARSVNTAISILEKYALTDDPKDAGDDGFGTCRDEDVNIANSFPSAAAGGSIDKLVAKAKEDEKQASTDAAAAKAVEAKTENEADASRARTEKKNIEVDRLRKELDDLRASKVTAADLKKKAEELAQAEKELAQAKADTVQQEADLQKAKIDSARAALASVQAELPLRKAAVLQAGAQLRRAVFYLTARDVDLAQKTLDGAIAEVDSTKALIKVAQERLDKLMFETKRDPDAPKQQK
jgi:hypothetical protein